MNPAMMMNRAENTSHDETPVTAQCLQRRVVHPEQNTRMLNTAQSNPLQLW
jgi:hypothetical protein